MIPLELCGTLLDERRRSSSVPRPLSAPACLNHMSQECPEFAHLCRARRHHQCHAGASRDKQEQDATAVVKVGTIRQHYYPEGGWGWTVCACGFFVHLLSDGLLASHGFMIVVVQKKFRDAAPSSAHGTGSVMKLGKPAKQFDETYPDWAPSLVLGYSAMNTDPSRHQRLEKRCAEKREAESPERRAEADAAATSI